MKPIQPKLLRDGRNTLAAFAVAGLAAFPANASDFDLNDLIEAAKSEPPITVYASTGKIKTAAEAFSSKYGIEASGSKVKGAAQIELVLREYQAGNVIGDLLISSDAAVASTELIPSGVVYSWLPPDLADDIGRDSRDPVVVWRDPAIWSYNNEKYETCPITNIWQLTESDWNRKVAFSDPLNKPGYIDWFNQMETHHDQAIADAYADHYGKELDTSTQSATKSWVEALAANAPLLTDSDSAAAEAIGAPGQEDPFMGLVSSSKYRDTIDGGLKMAICADLKPYVGFANPSYGLINAKTDSPNAAKLFLHFMMTEEGISPMTKDGKVSGNTKVPAHPDEASGVAALADRLTPHNASTGAEDFDKRQDWQDFWRVSYKR